MKVLFDSSVLAVAHESSNEARTGVFRVAERLFNHVVKRHKYAFISQHNLPESLVFAKDVPHIHLECEMLWASREYKVFSLFKNQSFGYKLARWGWFRAVRSGRDFYHIDTEKVEGFDIYHSPFHPIPPEINNVTQIKKLITIHDLIPKIHPEYFGAWHHKNTDRVLQSIQNDTYVSCVSESTKNDLKHFKPFLSEEQISVIPLAADKNLFYPVEDEGTILRVKKKYNLPIDEQYILSVSTVEPRKNLFRVLEAFKQLVKESKLNLSLVLVGSKGWKMADFYNQIAKDNSLKGRVFLTGFVDDIDLAPLYSGASVFVYPSLYEGFGLPVLEAMQCGVPVVTSSVSSLPEVCGDVGILVDPLNVNEIAVAIYQLLNEPRDIRRGNLLKRCSGFSWNRFDDSYSKLYQQIYTS